MSQVPDAACYNPARAKYDPFLRGDSTMVTVRPATRSDLLDMEALISRSVEMGDVLPRTLQELTDLLPSFFVAETEDGRIVGTAALEIYNQKLAEVRSLCTSPEARARE